MPGAAVKLLLIPSAADSEAADDNGMITKCLV
jgi:hypothetical protein